MLDPIADMLTRIRNAQRAGHLSVTLPASKMKQAIAEILEREGFVGHVSTAARGPHQDLVLELKYETLSPTEKRPAIQELTRVSTEGCRVYVKKNEVQKVKNGFGIAILSTSQGLMTAEQAAKQSLGGEYICKIW